MERITDRTLEPSPVDRFLTLSKHAFIAVFTGGLSLVWMIGRKVPTWWEAACLERARWIQDGRKPDSWKWVVSGWKASGATILVSIPVAMAMTAAGSFLTRAAMGPLPQNAHSLTGARVYVVMIVTPPVLACAIALTLISTWLWHSGRQAAALAWSNLRWSN